MTTDLDYYPLAIAAKKTDYSEQLLICLAAEDKLSLYVRLGEHKGLEIDCIEWEDEYGRKKEHWCCTNPPDDENNYRPLPLGLDPKKVPTCSIQAYQNNSNASLKDDLTGGGYQYNLIEAVPFKDIALLVSAEDVAQLSKKETVKNTFTDNERNTMLKLIIGMAMDAYGYDKDKTRNDATGDKNGISAKLQTHDINISDDTIRKYLKEAKNIL